MGFFFVKEVEAKRQTKQQRSLASLSKIGCAACPLNHAKVKSPKMRPTLADGCDIYFLGEAPGRIEDELGRPFVGPSGALLHHVIDRYNLNYSFDNTIRDRPPDNRDPTPVEISCCRGLVTKSIEQNKPKVIVGLGAHAQRWMLESDDQAGMRGRIFAVKVGSHSCWFMPTYHPARVLHSASEQAKKQGRNKRSDDNAYLVTTYFGRTFKLDLEKALTYAKLPPPDIENEYELRDKVTIASDFSALCKLLKEAKDAPYKAIDIETSTLRPYSSGAAILTVAISHNSTHFAFPLDHRLSKWSSIERKEILKLLESLLTDDTIKIAHNAPFEIEWFIHYFGKAIVNHAAWQCTQLQAHFLDERRGAGQSNDETSRRATYQSLDFLVRLCFGISFKHLFSVDRKRIANADLNETLFYNATDSRLTLKLWGVQRQRLITEGLYEAYIAALPRQPTVALMQHLGMPVNQHIVKELQVQLSDEIAVIEAEIEMLEVVQQYKKDHEKFNPVGEDAIVIFRDYLKRSEIQVQDGERLRWSIDKRILEKIDHPLAQLIVKLRNKSKMKSTYVDGLELGPGELVYPDNHIHCNFNSTFTTTGRFSCVAPFTKIPVKEIGEIPIKEIQVGDSVWTHKGRYQKVLAKYVKGREQMLAVHLNNGEVLTCTKKHRVLLKSGRWITVGELYGVFQILGINTRSHKQSAVHIQNQCDTFCGFNSQSVRDIKRECEMDFAQSYAKTGAESTSETEIFSVKDRRKEPDAGEERGRTPSMEGELSGRERILDPIGQWQSNLSASLCDDATTGSGQNTRRLGSASYRWRPVKQSPRQPCISNIAWAQNYSLQGIGNSSIEIEKIELSGSYEVFDITVEGDASYLACGVFSHNSDNPNMQNFPHRSDAWVRAQIEAYAGHLIIAADYGQLEMCGAAMCSADPYLVKVLWDDYDTHMDWASKLARACPTAVNGDFSDKGVAKAFRSLVKNKLVFPAIYGATNTSIAGYLNIDQAYIDKLMEEFWDTFKGVKKWQERLLREYRETGYVASPTGRRRHHPLTANEAINAPIQCLASEIVVEGMGKLSYMARTEGKWHLHPRLNIHDDLSFIVPEKKLVSSIETIYKTMLTPSIMELIPEKARVPLSVTVSIGQNWYSMDEVGKFWSHHDV